MIRIKAMRLLSILFGVSLPFGAVCAISENEVSELLAANLTAIQNVELKLVGERISAPNPLDVERVKTFFDQKIEKQSKETGSARLVEKLKEEREASIRIYSAEQKTPMSVDVQIGTLSSFTAVQDFLFEGA